MLPPDANNGQSRRQFIKTTAATAAGASLLPLSALARENNSPVAIVLGANDPAATEPSVVWAIEQLRSAFAARGVATQLFDQAASVLASQECVMATSNVPALFRQYAEARYHSSHVFPESFSISRARANRKTGAARQYVLAAGADVRGLTYALLELADRVTCAADPLAMLQALTPTITMEWPANTIRGVARAFASDVEDKAWFQSREFWSRYLTLLAAQRFNRFHLMLGLGYDFTTDITDCYFHFAYPFLISVPGYNVRAVPLPDAERDLNLEMLRFASDEAARRGLHFQLGVWTHAYQWTNSPRANYVIAGLTPQTHAPYCRDALRTLLAQCPNINGVTFRIHGESGVAEGNYDLWKTIFDGVAQCGRRVEIDMHAKGMDQGMIDVALGTGQPVNISPKVWAEHMGLPYMQGAIRPQELPRNNRGAGFFSRSSGTRSFLRYGYGDLFAENRRYGILHRLWPGTQRLLAWADPETAAAYGRVSSFCGGAGLELMEPLTFKGRKGSGLPGGRDAYADVSLKTNFDFEKYLLYYRVWGRALFSPDADADGCRRFLLQKFGGGAEAVAGALAAAGKILPLVTTAHCPSAANNNYWPEMYWNMPIVDPAHKHPYSDTPSPRRFGTVTPLDPEFFLGVDEFADELLAGKPSGKYSPAQVAAQLDDAAEKALAQLRRAKSKARDARTADFRRLVTDVTIQAGLGKFFAEKFRSAVLFAIYERSHDRGALQTALEQNRAARATWAALAAAANGVYRDDIAFGPDYYQRGHWRDRLPAIDADIADMEQVLAQTNANAPSSQFDPKTVRHALRAVFEQRELGTNWPSIFGHVPPAFFRRGQPLEIAANAKLPAGSRMELRYRRVDQSETWQMQEMQMRGQNFQAVIPSEYSDSPFPLQYYFRGGGMLHPGLHPGWLGQPYFVVRQA